MAALRGYSRVPDAAQILFGGTPQAQTQNRENNPMQSRMGPGSQRVTVVASGARERASAPHGVRGT